MSFAQRLMMSSSAPCARSGSVADRLNHLTGYSQSTESTDRSDSWMLKLPCFSHSKGISAASAKDKRENGITIQNQTTRRTTNNTQGRNRDGTQKERAWIRTGTGSSKETPSRSRVAFPTQLTFWMIEGYNRRLGLRLPPLLAVLPGRAADRRRKPR